MQKLAAGNCATPLTYSASWSFSYDGDGTRVAQLYTPYDSNGNVQPAVLTAYFMGGAYEVTGANAKKYYSIAGMTVAMNDGSGLQYLLTDHLGSVVAVTNASGTLTSQQRYLPFGQVRTDLNGPRITNTDFGYTGQRNNSDLGLMDYKARMYDAALGRFISPDTIIPSMANPQSWNRYSYVLNDPTVLTDPTGRTPCEGKNYDDGPSCLKNPNSQLSIEVANTKYQRDCAAGRNEACPGGTLGLIAFGVTAVVTAGLAESALLGGATADAADVALWKTGVSCLQNAVCKLLIGASSASTHEAYVRYMVNSELDDIKANEGILRGANALNGPTYFTNQYYGTVNGAQQTLSLRTPPEIGVEFQVINNPRIFGPTGVERIPGFTSGGGIQYWSFDQVQVTITRIWELIK